MHPQIDARMSTGAFAGIALAALRQGPPARLAGLLITAAILFILAGTVRDLFLRMMDAVDPRLISEMEAVAREVPGVLGVHDVRARWGGRELAMAVEQEIEHRVPAVRVDIHMDPGTDPHAH